MVRLHILLLFLLLFLLPVSGFSASTKWEETEESSVRFVAGSYDGNIISAGVHFQLAEGWKTYWRVPGDVGIAITIDFEGSKNIKKHSFLWPAPKRIIEYETIQSYVYKGEVIIPLTITTNDPSKPAVIKAKATYAVCSEICYFRTSDFVLNIPVNHIDESSGALINKYLVRVPKSNGNGGLKIVSASVMEGNILKVRAVSEKEFTRPDILVEVSPDFRFPAAEIKFSTNWKEAVFLIPYEVKLDGETLLGKKATFTLLNGNDAVEHSFVLPETIDSEATGKAQKTTPDSKKNSRNMIATSG